MRTITKHMLGRLEAQAQEAKLLGLNKVASNLENEVKIYSSNIRDGVDFYSYAQAEVEDDVQKLLWSAIVRIADFYEVPFNAANVQKTIDKVATELINEIKPESGVGAFEPSIPGEIKEQTSIEVAE